MLRYFTYFLLAVDFVCLLLTFSYNLSGILSECQNLDPNQIWHYVGTDLVWVQTVCKSCQLAFLLPLNMVQKS